MAKLTANIKNRVRKLPKPTSKVQAMQPMFEAVSNAIMATEEKASKVQKMHLPKSSSFGVVTIKVTELSKSDKLVIEISDQGVGFDKEHFDAFCEVDTTYKAMRGGKGVGRLFWLDAFQDIQVHSVFLEDGSLQVRNFNFLLADEEQVPELEKTVSRLGHGNTGSVVTLTTLRQRDYQKHFPKQKDAFIRYFSAHFIADFLVGSGPSVHVDLDGDVTKYPEHISELKVGDDLPELTLTNDDFGELKLKGFICKKEASTGLDGNHVVHFLADNRTVETRKIDGLIAIENISENGGDVHVLHLTISGDYLNKHVNEGRTAFVFGEEIVKQISRLCAEEAKAVYLKDRIASYTDERKRNFAIFLDRYPTYQLKDIDEQLNDLPFNANEPEEFAKGLVRYQIRRDEDRFDQMDKVIALLVQ